MSRILCTFGIMGLGAGFAFLALVALLMIPGNSESRAHAQSTSVSLGENTEYISPELWGTLQKHADGEDVPTNVIVELGTRSDITVTPVLSEYLTSINAVAIEGKKDTYRIPTASALAESTHREQPRVPAVEWKEERLEEETINWRISCRHGGNAGCYGLVR